MKFYREESEKSRIVCILCRHYCKLKEGQLGVCGVNKNEGGELKNLVYGHPSALNIDPIEKKPIYHMLPGTKTLSFGTIGCNFKCPFCQNWQISQERRVDETTYVSAENMVSLSLKYGVRSIAYTYNEPTVFYPYARDIGLIAKGRGLKNIFVSNGFETEEIVEDMSKWVDAANIDLKSWDDRYYKRVLKGGLEAVKDTLRLMVNKGIWVEVTTLIIEGENDSVKDLTNMGEFIVDELGNWVPWHLSAFHPDYKMNSHNRTKVDTLLKAKKIAEDIGLNYVYLGNISIDSHTLCPKCGEVLIRREGYSIVTNRLEDGKCPNCFREIEGVWR